MKCPACTHFEDALCNGSEDGQACHQFEPTPEYIEETKEYLRDEEIRRNREGI